MAAKTVMIRVPIELRERLAALAEQLLRSHEEGRTERVRISERGPECWVSPAEVIRLALDDMEDHTERSRKPRKAAKCKAVRLSLELSAA